MKCLEIVIPRRRPTGHDTLRRASMRFIAIGLPLVLTGFALSFLMVLRVLEPSFALSFLAYAASLLGLLLGLMAVMQHRGS